MLCDHGLNGFFNSLSIGDIDLNKAPLLTMLSDLFGYMGIEKQRFRISWVSASEGPKFADVVKRFTDQITELGPQTKLCGGNEE